MQLVSDNWLEALKDSRVLSFTIVGPKLNVLEVFATLIDAKSLVYQQRMSQTL